MKISTKGRYAITVMLDLAELYDTHKFVSLKSISEKEGISLKYLERIASSLKKAHLIESETGHTGGYRLLKDPSQYTLGDIIRGSSENLNITNCVDNCNLKNNCKRYPLWNDLNNELNTYLDSKTLKDYM